MRRGSPPARSAPAGASTIEDDGGMNQSVERRWKAEDAKTEQKR